MRAEPDAAAYRTAISHFATGVTVVTSMGHEGPSGLTANAVCSLSLDPLLMLVCLDRGSRTLAAVEQSRKLAVNILAEDQREVAVTFSTKEPAKFGGLSHEHVDGVPVLDGVVAWLTGDLQNLLPGGDHVIGVAAVRSVQANGGRPLIYYRGDYHSLTLSD
jgi:flavin reductase (DIM6/NTAB) family NADH-FMN oxidoreductase RutF